MYAPTYRWTCHKCDRGNESGLVACSYCDFPAVASSGEIAKAKGEADPMIEGYKSLKSLAWFAVLFPWWY